MMKLRISILAVLFCILSAGRSDAQTIPVGDIREEQIRLQQLLVDSVSFSFTHRATTFESYARLISRAPADGKWWNQRLLPRRYDLGNGFEWGIYEPHIQNTWNSLLPVGGNNGAAWYGGGFNVETQGGLFLDSDYLSLSLRPHIIWQQNTDFSNPLFIPYDNNVNVLYGAEGIYDRIDRPWRFGPDPFWTVNLGHSSLRFHYDNFEAGIGNEPMWWGPGIQNALVMSNNAPGFLRYFLGTRQPQFIPHVGTLEFTWTIGFPQDSEWYGYEDQNRGRLFNGFNLTYTPILIPNLHIGITRAFQQYRDTGTSLGNVFSVFDPTQKEVLIDENGNPVENQDRNMMGSIYARWIWPEANAEVYAEYYREASNYNGRDAVTEPNQNRGYTLGFQKIAFPGLVDMVKVSFEYNNLIPPAISQVRYNTYYYTHLNVRQGHTNRGQVLGASIGPGSDSFFLGIDTYKDNFKVGGFLQRWTNNDHFHYEIGRRYTSRPYNQHQVNLNFGLDLLYKLDDIMFAGKIMRTQAFNFRRSRVFRHINFDDPERVQQDKFNTQIQLSVRYLF